MEGWEGLVAMGVALGDKCDRMKGIQLVSHLMNKIVKIALVSIFYFIQQPVHGQDLSQGLPYQRERAKLLAAGWQKVLKPHRHCNDLAQPAKTTCYKYPEVEDCSINGYCKFSWTLNGSRFLYITTFGMVYIVNGWVQE